jgi:DNA helicase-2/ATP-dependent DNA helicase PcrA
MSKQHFNELFEKEFQKLNDHQKQAVNQIEGPVLVIAGPGTGKTQILAARIAAILQKTDSLPENILCLTYTDAGTIAMRKRLLQFIGPDAYRVGIYTFHSFCNLVIQDHLELFGLRSLDAISELEQIQYVHEIIDSFQKDNPLKRYTDQAYFDTKRLLNLYETMKKEGWSSSFIIQKTDEYILSLPTRDSFIYKKDTKYGKKGTVKQKQLDEAIKKMEQLKAASQTFESYQQKLKNNNRYDFADMILWVIDAFKVRPELLMSYQEQYQYFLVDEFQDTSGSQNDLLQLMVDYWDAPNVFAVGDEDQSIYRFQGANVENIIQYKTKYAQYLETVILKDNYRSSQKILDASKALIEMNNDRFLEEKTLIASNVDVSKIESLPEICCYHNFVHEAVGIALQIENLQKQGVPLNEIAVIYRNHSQAEDIISYLHSKKIPLNSKKRIDVLQEPLIKKIITILRFLQAEVKRPNTGEHFLFEILHYDVFKIPAIEIAGLSTEIFYNNTHEKKITNITWREALSSYKSKKQPTLFTANAAHEAIQHFSKTFEDLIKEAANLPLQQLIEKILNTCGLLVAALTSSEKIFNLEILNTFFDFVKNECAKNSKTSIHSILETISLMDENHVSLPAQKISYSENGINFLTAHSSKGLEFEYVFMLGCLSDKWDTTRSRNNFTLPDNLFAIEGDETEEARRLFYVAMTRAKKQLSISYPKFNNNGKELEKSRFVAELEDSGKVSSKQIQLSDDALIDFNLNILKHSQASIPAELIDTLFIDSILEKYTLSVTHLNNYLKCPITFYFNNLIRVPAPKSARMTFGSAVHFALEKLFKNMNAHPEKSFGTKEDLLKDFKWYMQRNEECFTDADFKRRIEYAEKILPDYYDHYIHEWNKVTSIERSYRNVVVDGVPINGKIDKLEFEGNFVNVVDYKTGKFKNAEKKFNRLDLEKNEVTKSNEKQLKFEEEFGGDYWRQAVFYKILIDNDKNKTWEMKSTEFDFIEPDTDSKKFIKQRVNITSEDVEIVKHQIKSAYTKILNKEFKNGCGKPDCDWCNFVEDFYSGNKTINPPHPIWGDE